MTTVVALLGVTPDWGNNGKTVLARSYLHFTTLPQGKQRRWLLCLHSLAIRHLVAYLAASAQWEPGGLS